MGSKLTGLKLHMFSQIKCKMIYSNSSFHEKGKPAERQGRKAKGPSNGWQPSRQKY
jgi:hypothetical protein